MALVRREREGALICIGFFFLAQWDTQCGVFGEFCGFHDWVIEMGIVLHKMNWIFWKGERD